MAKGKPPNAGAQNARQIERMIKSMRPRLKPEDGFSHGLCDLVAYVLQLEPEKRPSMDNVLQHPWIYDTEETHPTATLRELIRVYEGWASSGGQRQSLIQEHGAAAAKFPEDPKDFEDWRFSVVSIGEAYYDNVDNLARATDPTMDLEMAQREENNLNSLIPESSYTPNDSPTHGVTMKTTASEESRIQGVGAKFAQFFQGEGYSGSEAMPQVEPNRPRSDLLLRNDTSESDASQKENNRKKTNFRGTPVDTTRANQTGKPVEQAVDRDARRGTLLQNWDFGQASRPIQEPNHEYQQMPNISPDWIQSHRVQNHSFEDLGAPGDDVEVAEHSYALPSRPALHHYATAPVEPPMLRSSIDTATSRQTLDLDALMNEGSYDYNPPSSSQPYGYNAPSPQQYNAPAAYQPYANTAGASASMMDAQDFSYNAPSPRNDYHIDAISPTTVAGPQDDQSQYATMTARSTITNGSSAYDLTERARGTTNGRTHTPTDSIYGPTYDDITRPSPPSAAAMASDAPAEIIGGELERLALDYQQVLHSAAGLWEDESFGEEDADDGEDEEGNHNAGLDDH